uniref:Uncharacterized protein n=1 Tax=Arundo donax TaxID=35708 RepID=A0A0A9DU09_ARUDO
MEVMLSFLFVMLQKLKVASIKKVLTGTTIIVIEETDKKQIIPNKNSIASDATMNNPALDSGALIKPLDIFLQHKKSIHKNYMR